MPDQPIVVPKSDTPAPRSDPDARVDNEKPKNVELLETSRAYDLLRGAVLADVIRWLEEDRARRRIANLTMASIATVALVAIGGFIVNQLLVFNVDRSVNEAVTDNLSSVTFQSRVAALNFTVLALEQETRFSDAQADAIVQAIASLYETGVSGDNISADARSQNESDLLFAVETAVERFAGADRTDLVSRIRDVAPRISDRSSVMTQILVQMTGRNLIGLPGGADSWANRTGIERDLYQEYEEYVTRARDTGFPELYLVFELIVRHMEGRPEGEIRELASEVEDLSDVDTTQFVAVMTALVTGGFIREPTAASERVRARAREFLEAYGDINATLAAVAIDDSGLYTMEDVDSAQEIRLGVTEQYPFEPEGFGGWYHIEIPDPDVYRIDVRSTSGDPVVEVWHEDGGGFELVASDDDGGVGLNSMLNVELGAGTYYVRVRNLNAGDADFSIAVRLLEP